MRIPTGFWYAVAGAVALSQVGWALGHDRSLAEAAITGLLEFGLVAGFVWLVTHYSGAVNRRGGASFRLAFTACWLLTAAICIPIFSGADRADEQSVGGFFFTLVVFLPLLVGLISAVPLSRGWGSSGWLIVCRRCATQGSVRARFCTACGAELKDR